jgi:hypothetical protein
MMQNDAQPQNYFDKNSFKVTILTVPRFSELSFILSLYNQIFLRIFIGNMLVGNGWIAPTNRENFQ